MTILSAQSISERHAYAPIITPFFGRTHIDGMTFGLSAAGYDVRIKQAVTLLPGECKLASTVEHFSMPFDLLAMVADKSTWARRFVTVQHTVIEPGWSGHLTLELINHSALIVEIPAGAPIAQIIFHALDEPTQQPYSGKYQNQADEPVPAKFTWPHPDATEPYIPRLGHEATYNTSEPTVADCVTARGRFRIVPSQSADDWTNVYVDNKRIAYVDCGKLFLIGKEGHAEPICDVDDLDCLPSLLQQHYRAI